MYIDTIIDDVANRWGVRDTRLFSTYETAEWYSEIATSQGVLALQDRLSIAVPEALLEFWACPGLVHRLAFFKNYDFFGDEPFVLSWDDKRWLWIADDLGHAGGMLGAELDSGDNPAVAWGWPDDPKPAMRIAPSFSGWLATEIDEVTGRGRTTS